MVSVEDATKVLSEAAGDLPMTEATPQPSSTTSPTVAVASMTTEQVNALYAVVNEERLRRLLSAEKGLAFSKYNSTGVSESLVGNIGLPVIDRAGRGDRLMDECVMGGALLQPGRICCSNACLKRLEVKNRYRNDEYCVHNVSRTPDEQPNKWLCL